MSGSHDTYIVPCLLHCFTLVCLDERDMIQNVISYQGSSWSTDIDWLATMIIRSGTELPKLFETIHASGILGPCMEEELEQFMNSGLKTTISQNPQERAGVLEPDGYPVPNHNYFGFWLPHGLDAFNQVEQVKRCLARFNRIEAAFREIEGIPQNRLWLGHEQVAFFEQSPELVPGFKNDRPDSMVGSSEL